MISDGAVVHRRKVSGVEKFKINTQDNAIYRNAILFGILNVPADKLKLFTQERYVYYLVFLVLIIYRK